MLGDRKDPRQSVFVSFSSADRPTAEALVAAIEGRRTSTFFAPRDILAGENFGQRIVQAIGSCDCVIVLLSAASIESPYVQREVRLAIDERRRLVPVALNGIQFPQDFPARVVVLAECSAGA